MSAMGTFSKLLRYTLRSHSHEGMAPPATDAPDQMLNEYSGERLAPALALLALLSVLVLVVELLSLSMLLLLELLPCAWALLWCTLRYSTTTCGEADAIHRHRISMTSAQCMHRRCLLQHTPPDRQAPHTQSAHHRRHL
jgi:hypothetical protein